MSIRNKHPRDYRLIDVMGGSANPRNTSQQKFVKETDAINIQINKKFPCFDEAIMEEAL